MILPSGCWGPPDRAPWTCGAVARARPHVPGGPPRPEQRCRARRAPPRRAAAPDSGCAAADREPADRKSTRLNSSHSQISYAVFCLKKKKKNQNYIELINNYIQDLDNIDYLTSSTSIENGIIMRSIYKRYDNYILYSTK